MSALFLLLQRCESRSFLEDLGNSSKEVAETLDYLNIQGVRHTLRTFNPIVRYAQRHFADALTIDVISGSTLHVVRLCQQTDEIPLPQSVIDFLADFNRGSYPQLESAI